MEYPAHLRMVIRVSADTPEWHTRRTSGLCSTSMGMREGGFLDLPVLVELLVFLCSNVHLGQRDQHASPNTSSRWTNQSRALSGAVSMCFPISGIGPESIEGEFPGLTARARPGYWQHRLSRLLGVPPRGGRIGMRATAKMHLTAGAKRLRCHRHRNDVPENRT